MGTPSVLERGNIIQEAARERGRAQSGRGAQDSEVEEEEDDCNAKSYSAHTRADESHHPHVVIIWWASCSKASVQPNRSSV